MPSLRVGPMNVTALHLNGSMEPIRYINAGRSVNPNGALLRFALVEIGQELDRQADGDLGLDFTPFGPIDGYLPNDQGAALSRSMALPSRKAGLLRFDQPRRLGLTDLPRLTVAAGKPSSRPAHSKAVTAEVSPREVVVCLENGERVNTLRLDDLLYVRIDSAGWFFFVGRESKGDPLAIRLNAWLIPGLALLIAGAARKGTLKDLEAEIEKKAQML